MEPVIKYARTVLNSIEKHPNAFGETEAAAMQYLLALEFLALGLGFPKGQNLIRDEYTQVRKTVFGANSEDTISALKTIRNGIDLDVELV